MIQMVQSLHAGYEELMLGTKQFTLMNNDTIYVLAKMRKL